MDARTRNAASSSTEHEITIERHFALPAGTLWQAITDPDQMRQWYMPQLQSFKAEVGFKTQFTVSHNGKNFAHLWEVTEVTPGRRITYSWAYAGYPGISHVSFELFPEKNGTRLKLVHSGLETFQPDLHPDLAFRNFLAGWTSLADSLQKFTDTMSRTITVERILDAPRELVWEAMTNPEHVVHWWGPNGFTNTLEKMDFRVGGEWHHIMHGPDGTDYPNKSIFTAIDKPKRIELCNGGTHKGDPKANFDATWTFEVVNGKTRVTIHLLFPTTEARTRAVERHGAIDGGQQTLARLEGYLSKIESRRNS